LLATPTRIAPRFVRVGQVPTRRLYLGTALAVRPRVLAGPETRRKALACDLCGEDVLRDGRILLLGDRYEGVLTVDRVLVVCAGSCADGDDEQGAREVVCLADLASGDLFDPLERACSRFDWARGSIRRFAEAIRLVRAAAAERDAAAEDGVEPRKAG
jgi:hypothetical protein